MGTLRPLGDALTAVHPMFHPETLTVPCRAALGVFSCPEEGFS